MKLTLQRLPQESESTPGTLAVNEAPFCDTQELPVKDGLPGSAIPAGTYEIKLQPSPHFQASDDPWVQAYASAMPHIVGIPGRDLIMIHWGNKPTQILGCVEVGFTRAENWVGSSRPAFARLYPLIHDAIESGEGCTIDVIDWQNDAEQVSDATKGENG